MARFDFSGTTVALVTPFRDGRIDFEAVDRLVDRAIEAGLEAVSPCGTTGESPTLSDEEQAALIERVVSRAGGRIRVLAGTGSYSTAEAVRRTRRAADLGADGVLLVTPYYNRPSQAGLFAHYAAVAEATDRPIVLYNVPARTGVSLAPDTVVRLAERYDNIVAIKEASGSTAMTDELVASGAITVLSGDDPLTCALMALGARGVVSVLANLEPQAVKSMVDAALRGDFATARRIHAQTVPLARALMSLDVNPVPIKAALAERGLISAEVRLPLVTLAEDRRATLRTLLGRFEAARKA